MNHTQALFRKVELNIKRELKRASKLDANGYLQGLSNCLHKAKYGTIDGIKNYLNGHSGPLTGIKLDVTPELTTDFDYTTNLKNSKISINLVILNTSFNEDSVRHAIHLTNSEFDPTHLYNLVLFNSAKIRKLYPEIKDDQLSDMVNDEISKSTKDLEININSSLNYKDGALSSLNVKIGRSQTPDKYKH